VLIVGAGAVGGFLAEELARIGFSPLRLLDRDTLAVENLIRHPLGAPALGQSKALALAAKIRHDFPPCEAIGHHVDFLDVPAEQQRSLVDGADVVVALAAGKPAVYPAVWVDPRIRDAEVGEILWVLPGRRTPCYECAAAFRQATADTQAARGARVDIQLVALATAQVVTALAHPDDDRSAILDPRRTAIYLHGLTPTSPGVRATFPTSGLSSRNVRVPFPSRPCAACRGWRYVATSPASATLGAGGRPGDDRTRGWPIFAAILLGIVVLFIVSLAHGTHT
jgi:hypothetical protein